jgi:hypothetical protein
MIQVLEEGRWWTPEPSRLVDGLFHRRYTSATQARDSGRPGDVQVLPLMLTDDHYSRISNRLLTETKMVYRCEIGALGLDHLEGLCRDLSGWPQQNIHGQDLQIRALWLSAWLAELLHRTTEAMDRYRRFLALKTGRIPRNLNLIARNNLAILLLKRGQFSAVSDLAELAIVREIPASCLSLLNVLLVAQKRFNTASQRKVEGHVIRVLQQECGRIKRKAKALPEFKESERRLRQHVTLVLAPWIGRFAAAMLYDGRDVQLLGRSEVGEFTAALCWLAANLRLYAASVSRTENVLDELDLWSHPRDLLLEDAKLEGSGDEARWAEGLSLLYAHDVPDGPAGEWQSELERLEQARRAYQDAYRDLEAGRFDAAEADLEELDEIVGEPGMGQDEESRTGKEGGSDE